MAGPSRIIVAATALIGSALAAPASLGAQEAYPIETRIWTDRGDDPFLRRGERVRLYYEVSADAYVAVFQIDTDGTARLVFPRSPEENHYVRGGQDYRLLFPRSPYWHVEDYPGVGYYFVVASPRPFDFSAFRYSHYGNGWDLTRVGRTVYRDPYRAIDDFVAYLIPDWERVPYGLDFVEYRVGENAASYSYPRFLCYDCHGFRPYYAWNPYRYTCLSYRVVIFDHPYYYARTRYRGSAVVYTRPPVSSGPRFAFKERARGEAGSPLVVRSAEGGVADRPGVRGDPGRRRSAASGREGATATPPRSGVAGTRGRPTGREGVAPGSGGERPGTAGTPPRRPSSILPGRGGRPAGAGTRPGVRVEPRSPRAPRVTRPSEGGAERGSPPAGSERSRPVLRRRPGSGGSSGSSARPSRRSGGSSGSSARPPRRSGGSSGGSARPSRRSGGSSGGSARPSRRSGGSSGGSARRGSSRRSGGGGGDDGFVSVQDLASHNDDDGVVSVSSLAARAAGGGEARGSSGTGPGEAAASSPEGARSSRSTGSAARRPGARSRGTTSSPGASTRGSRTVVRGVRPSSAVRGESAGRSAASSPSPSAASRGAGWVVRGARPAPSSARSSSPSRGRASGTTGTTRPTVIHRGGGGSGSTRSSGGSVTRLGGSRSSAPAARRSSGSRGSTGGAERRPPPSRRRGGG